MTEIDISTDPETLEENPESRFGHYAKLVEAFEADEIDGAVLLEDITATPIELESVHFEAEVDRTTHTHPGGAWTRDEYDSAFEATIAAPTEREYDTLVRAFNSTETVLLAFETEGDQLLVVDDDFIPIQFRVNPDGAVTRFDLEAAGAPLEDYHTNLHLSYSD